MTAVAHPAAPVPQWLTDAVNGLVAAAYEAGRADASAVQAAAQPDMPETLNRREAAAHMRIGLTSLDALIRSGELASRMVGGRRLIRRTDVDAYLAGQVTADS